MNAQKQEKTMLDNNGTFSQIHSFRAECAYDVTRLRELLLSRKIEAVVSEYPCPLVDDLGREIDVGELMVEIKCNITVDQLRDLMYELIDSHIMTQTLRAVPLDKNPLTRDSRY